MLLAGADFTPAVADRGGPQAVAAAGVEWLARPVDLEDWAWQDPGEFGTLLIDWHARLDLD